MVSGFRAPGIQGYGYLVFSNLRLLFFWLSGSRFRGSASLCFYEP